MHCPKCGKKLNPKYRYCPSCLSKSLGIEDVKTKNDVIKNEPQKYVHKNFIGNKKENHVHFTNNTKKNKSNVDSSNVNGYIVSEGMSIKGGKLRKGSDTSRHALHNRWRYGY